MTDGCTFINSVFLIFISVYIVFEAISRSIQPKHIHGDNLIVIAFLGLLVNLIGIYFFHGEHGFHNECSHSHDSQNHKEETNLNQLSSEAKLNNVDEEKNETGITYFFNLFSLVNKSALTNPNKFDDHIHIGKYLNFY